MHRFKIFTYSLLLAVTPSLLVYPQNNLPSSQIQKVHLEENTESNNIFSYNEIMEIIDVIESEKLEKSLTYTDLEWACGFLALLAKLGVLPDDSEDFSDDIEELLHTYSFYYDLFVPFVLNKDELLDWTQNQWEIPKKFIKKHKKAIIIGNAILTATSAVMKKEANPILNDALPKTAHEDHSLTAMIKEEIFSFKEILAKEGFFSPVNPSGQQELSWEEQGKILGSLLGHHMQNKKDIYLFSTSKESSNMSIDFGHLEIDYRFSTNYAHFYTTADKKVDFVTISYQALEEKALKNNHLIQAVDCLGKTIECNPENPLSYLERGIAHFGLGQYDRSLEDYYTYSLQIQKTQPLLISDFSLGFAKGIPEGICESGKGFFLFLSDSVIHPIHTGEQIWNALVFLNNLARSEECDTLISKILVPEAYQLVKEWDTLSSDIKGELAGYIFGKHGSDMFILTAITEAIDQGAKEVQEIDAAYRSLQTAEKTFLLESIARLENSAKIARVVQLEKQFSSWLGTNTQLIRNKSGDPIFISKDGLRKVHFDFNHPSSDERFHLYLEHFINGEWTSSD